LPERSGYLHTGRCIRRAAGLVRVRPQGPGRAGPSCSASAQDYAVEAGEDELIDACAAGADELIDACAKRRGASQPGGGGGGGGGVSVRYAGAGECESAGMAAMRAGGGGSRVRGIVAGGSGTCFFGPAGQPMAPGSLQPMAPGSLSLMGAGAGGLGDGLGGHQLPRQGVATVVGAGGRMLGAQQQQQQQAQHFGMGTPLPSSVAMGVAPPQPRGRPKQQQQQRALVSFQPMRGGGGFVPLQPQLMQPQPQMCGANANAGCSQMRAGGDSHLWPCAPCAGSHEGAQQQAQQQQQQQQQHDAAYSYAQQAQYAQQQQPQQLQQLRAHMGGGCGGGCIMPYPGGGGPQACAQYGAYAQQQQSQLAFAQQQQQQQQQQFYPMASQMVGQGAPHAMQRLVMSGGMYAAPHAHAPMPGGGAPQQQRPHSHTQPRP
jgi:hypothetical protein